MKYVSMAAACLVFSGITFVPALAQDRPTTKGPPQTMGDQGKLPATGTVNNAVPEMGATGAGTGETGAGSASPKGPPQRMGDQGTLPATGTTSNKLPQMRAPTAPESTDK
jgi:hypothetical protein